MEKRSFRMGVDEAKKIVDDTLNTELSSKGFLVASYDKIVASN